MLLTALREYAEENKDLPEFHSRQQVPYALDLDREGNFIGFRKVDMPPPTLTIPYVTRTVAVRALPVDRGDYTLGVVPPKKTVADQAKAAARTPIAHGAYVALLAEAAAITGLPEFAAMHRFASTVDVEALPLPEGFDASRFVAVYVDRRLVTDNPVAQRWWAARLSASKAPPTAANCTCSVCGAASSPAEAVPVPIRGLASLGGQATMALISGKSPDHEVYERHGLPWGTGASICLACGEATHSVLNQLIADPVHAKRLGKVLYVWWSTVEADDFLAALISGDSDEAVAATLSSVLTGKPQPDLDAFRFIGVSLGANSARVVVRSWTDVTIATVKANLKQWFGRTALIGPNGSQPRALGAFVLLASVAPPGQGSPLSRIDPGLVERVITAALDGSALPPSLLAHALARTRAELGHLTAARAALLKACITPADHPSPEKHMTALDTSSTDTAYLCGRLLALLDEAARLATSANNALVDRSYSAASTMPAITFTRLLRLHRAHIDKLRRDKRGAAVRIDQTVTNILDGVRDLPRTFSIAEQARFALGLYHQQAERHAAQDSAKAARLLSEDSPTQEDA